MSDRRTPTTPRLPARQRTLNEIRSVCDDPHPKPRADVVPLERRGLDATGVAPEADIRRTRLPRLVIKAGRVYDPATLMTAVEGKIGPMSAADTAAWAPTPRRGRSAPSR